MVMIGVILVFLIVLILMARQYNAQRENQRERNFKIVNETRWTPGKRQESTSESPRVTYEVSDSEGNRKTITKEYRDDTVNIYIDHH
jgi:cytoskeletal protein RodZ